MNKENFYLHYDENYPCKKMILFADLSQGLIQKIEEEIPTPLHIIGFSDFDWNNDFSPWAYEQYAGNGDKTIELALEGLTGDVMVTGYSMGGLLALCASLQDPRIKSCASVSGSLWYPDLIVHLMNYSVQNKNYYLSLGNQEFKSKNVMMSNVNERTNTVRNILESENRVFFEWNDGNHFQSPEDRIIKGIKYLIKHDYK